MRDLKNNKLMLVYWPMLVQADKNHTQKHKSPVRKPGISYAEALCLDAI